MATPQAKQSQSDPTKDIFIDALKTALQKPENVKHQKNIKAMIAQATKFGPPKPKHTWWALNEKVYEVENRQFQQTMVKHAKDQNAIFSMRAVAFQGAQSKDGSHPTSALSSANPINPPDASQMAQSTEYKQKLNGHPQGMHQIYCKVRLGPHAGTDDKDEGIDLDVCNDTGSTLHTIHQSTWDKFLKAKFKGKRTPVRVSTAGGLFDSYAYDIQLRIYNDMERTKPLTEWFHIETVVRPDTHKQLSGSELRNECIFATPMGNEKLIAGTSKLGVAWRLLFS
ncbi:hypothetical protein F5883DRAFT_539250 [Diaporthe sp. PMI_573]|nr:hypothetical protein F5883DRAFT_539250 [Diaporthaceae sp. PMI_573]